MNATGTEEKATEMDGVLHGMRGSRRSIVLWAALAASILPGAVSWACTAQARITMLPTAGPPGSQITVAGTGFNSGPVQIRWNSSKGPVVGTAEGPSFSVWVKVPASSSQKVYYVLATQGPFKATEPFEVTGESRSQGSSAPSTGESPARSTSSDLWSALASRTPSAPDGLSAPGSPASVPVQTLGFALMAAGFAGLLACLVVAVLVRSRHKAT